MKRKILIVEDNLEISDIMRNYLLRAEHSVYQAFDGRQAIELARNVNPDLVLLDIMLPEYDGYEVCASIRFDKNIPIIIVSAKENEEDKLRMFELGADDYITKPFSFNEMVMRVNAQLRRYYNFNKIEDKKIRHYGKLAISTDRMEAKADGQLLNLTSKEFKMLDIFTRNCDQIFSKQKLIDKVWGYNEYIDENTVAVTVSRLREKLSKMGINNIKTVWGFGYKWQS